MRATGTTASRLKPTKSIAGEMGNPENLATEQRRNTILQVQRHKPTISQAQSRFLIMEQLRRGRFIQPFQPVLHWVRPTGHCTEHQQVRSLKPTSLSMPTTAVAQVWLTSTSLSLKRLQTSPTTHQTSPSFEGTPWPTYQQITPEVLSFHGPSHQHCRQVFPSTTVPSTVVHCQT